MRMQAVLIFLCIFVLVACKEVEHPRTDMEKSQDARRWRQGDETIAVGKDIPPVSAKGVKAWERYKEDGLTEEVRADLETAYRDGDLAAGHNLSHALRGTGLEDDREEANDILVDLSEKGLAVSQTQLGAIYLASSVEDERCRAKVLFEDAAADGVILAETYLGYVYQYGVCVRNDPMRAERYFRSASEKGDGLAKALLAEIYFNSSKKNEKLEEIKTLLEESERTGNAIGKSLLGQVLVTTDEDRARGEKLLVEAAELGIADAAVFYSKMYAVRGVGEESRKKQESALRLLKRLEKIKESNVLYQIGVHYTYGYGIDQDRTKAVDYFHDALKNGNLSAGFMLGMFRLHGEGMAKDECKAAGYFSFVARRGHERAKQELEKIDVDKVCD